VTVNLTVNGQRRTITIEPRTTLLDAVRENLALTGTKKAFDVLFVGGFDEEASPLGTKGLGELTAVSVAPAIANAVYHATGKRIRDLPVTVEKLL
jgi:xanthine dehydrogenase YagR molybdenum-binding subunit